MSYISLECPTFCVALTYFFLWHVVTLWIKGTPKPKIVEVEPGDATSFLTIECKTIITKHQYC